MNYYIQGNKERADQIKAAFEKLGIDVLDFGFADKTVVYCSIGGCGGCVQSLPYCINLMHIFHSHPDYQELELSAKAKFKVGDWIIDKYQLSEVFNVSKVLDHTYEIIDKDGYNYHVPHYKVEEDYRFWTINDAKNGDVLVIEKTPINHESIFIFQKINENRVIHYCYYFNVNGEEVFGKRISNNFIGHMNQSFHPATKEQRNLLFQKMKEDGYEWDERKKELRKIKPHYDIANFHVGMPVLVRDYDDTQWRYVQFSHCVGKDNPIMFNACGNTWIQCIPYNDDTKHLLGTTDMCPEEYINW